jgi:hypothetical protein
MPSKMNTTAEEPKARMHDCTIWTLCMSDDRNLIRLMTGQFEKLSVIERALQDLPKKFPECLYS